MPLFTETQRFRQPWIWLLAAILVGATLAPIGTEAWRQLVLHTPGTGRALTDPALLWAFLGSTAIVAAILWLLLASYLRVEVREDSLFIRFFPFIRGRLIPYSRISEAGARTYNPLLEYGGWGIRYGSHGKAYNVSGNRGVQLRLANGERLLIGSQQADRLAAAIEERLHAGDR